VLGRHRLDRLYVGDLPALDRGDGGLLQGLPAAGAPGRPVLPRSDFGDGFAGPSDDGGFDEFREFVFTRAARSATCDCSKASCSRSAAFSAACSSIRASRSASSSRSRVFAARSPSSPLSGTPGISGTSERCHDSAPPTNRQASKRLD
jgi:hypothetical protein